MSNEESDIDDNDEQILVIKRLPWRSEKVNHFIKSLDEKHQQRKTLQARRQEKRRVQDREVSSRPGPSLTDLPGWVFTE